jgi:hypothetical protein
VLPLGRRRGRVAQSTAACSGGRRATRCRHARLSYGQPDKATPVPRRRTPATQAGQWGSQPPHRQTDRSDRRRSARRPPEQLRHTRQRLGDAAWTLDKRASISAEQGIEAERSPHQVVEGGSRICFVRDPEKPNGSRRIGSAQLRKPPQTQTGTRIRGWSVRVCRMRGARTSTGCWGQVEGGESRSPSRPIAADMTVRRAWHAFSSTTLGHDSPGASSSQGQGLDTMGPIR